MVDFDGNSLDSGYHLAGFTKSGSSFQWHASPSINGTVSGWFPQDGKFDTGDGVVYAGNHVMALGRNIVYGYNGEFWGGGQASQWLNFLDNGLMVGLFGTYEGAGSVGANAVDGFAGNAVSPTLVRGPDGNVYLYHNDECNPWWNKPLAHQRLGRNHRSQRCRLHRRNSQHGRRSRGAGGVTHFPDSRGNLSEWQQSHPERIRGRNGCQHLVGAVL